VPSAPLTAHPPPVRSGASFAERLIAFACVEGIFFSGRRAVGAAKPTNPLR
jgi:hypothetical protein